MIIWGFDVMASCYNDVQVQSTIGVRKGAFHSKTESARLECPTGCIAFQRYASIYN